MNEINQATYQKAVAEYQNTVSSGKTDSTSGKKEVSGAGTYGNPKLSQKALDYYNSLKKKYGNLNFVLVSAEKKQEAESMKGSFANTKNLTVLIDTDKIEQMAEDEKYRDLIEGTISRASSGISKLATKLQSSSSKVTAYGMTIDKNGMASFFAVVDKALAKQKERIEKKKIENKEEKKAKEKKAEKEEKQEKVTISANSIEELLLKIEEYEQNYLTDNVKTDQERVIGQSVDYSV